MACKCNRRMLCGRRAAGMSGACRHTAAAAWAPARFELLSCCPTLPARRCRSCGSSAATSCGKTCRSCWPACTSTPLSWHSRRSRHSSRGRKTAAALVALSGSRTCSSLLRRSSRGRRRNSRQAKHSSSRKHSRGSRWLPTCRTTSPRTAWCRWVDVRQLMRHAGLKGQLQPCRLVHACCTAAPATLLASVQRSNPSMPCPAPLFPTCRCCRWGVASPTSTSCCRWGPAWLHAAVLV